MARESYAFRVEDIEPSDPAYLTAPDQVKRDFWQMAVRWVKTAMDRQLARGIGADGNPLTPISEATRKKGRWRSHTGRGTPYNPPLVPAQAISRTRQLFDARAHYSERYILGFWRFDDVSGRLWGQILDYHRKGKGRLPVRNVFGLSPASMEWVRGQGQIWWNARKRGIRMEEQAKRFRIEVPPEVAARAKRPVPEKRPVPKRPRVVVGEVDPFRHATFGIGASEQQVRQAYREGSLSKPKRLGDVGTYERWKPLPPPPPRGGSQVPFPPKPPKTPGMPPGRVAAGPRPDLSARAKPARPTRPPPVPPARPQRRPAPLPPPVPPPLKPPVTPAAAVPTRDENIALAAKRATRQGIMVMENGATKLKQEVGEEQAKRIPAAFHSSQSSQIILINEEHSFWDDPVAWMTQQAQESWLSTGARDHVITHEIGHALHQKALGHASFATMVKTGFNKQKADLIDWAVSRYATTNRAEFIAEVYAGLSAGLTYPDEIMQLYVENHGPIP